MKLKIGCSGWSYTSWEEIFYPKNEKNKLSFYSKYFVTAEIDSTFYEYPNEKVIESWIRNSPNDFIFSLKIPKIITHDKKISFEMEVFKDLNKFLSIIEIMYNKVGVLLIQLPPGFKRNKHRIRLENFLSLLPSKYKWAVEFRDLSWHENSVFKMLERYNVGYTIVDEPLLPSETIVTSSFSFIRFHGKGKSVWYNYLYSEEELDDWAKKFEKIKEQVNEIFAYFNNHYKAYAVLNAFQFLKILGEIKPEQEEMLKKVKKNVLEEKRFGILQYLEIKEKIPEEIKNLTTEKRFEKGIKIEEKEISIKKISKEGFEGWVSGYFIEINFKNKKIKHECPDWIENIRRNKLILCKHIIAFLSKIPRKEVKKLTESLIKEKWKFEARISL